MEYRNRPIIFIDRVISKMHAQLPAAMRNGLAAQLENLYRRPTSKLQFMESMDRFQAALYERLLETYREESFSQLLSLKICNLAVAKYHFVNRHSVLVSGPLQLTADPANACQLACPGCVHTANREHSKFFDWPASTLPVPVYERFLEQTGTTAFYSCLYNYGEPLLHKRFVDFVRTSKKYLLFTATSTNLSMPVQNPDEIVASGLDRMILSIDGTTQEVYAKYRREGDLELVFDNVKKLVASKRALGSSTPHFVWQFLTFQHNAHQVEDAMRMAMEFGINEVLIETPFGVAWDEPEIQAVTVPNRGSHTFVRSDGKWCTEDRRKSVTAIAGTVQSMFSESWQQRLHRHGHPEEETQPQGTCDWLYQNLTLDGAARILPCCMAPDKGEKHLVFTRLPTDALVNSEMARLARLSFGNRPQYEREVRAIPGRHPYCANCRERPLPYGLPNIEADIRAIDTKAAIPRAVRTTLCNWPK